MDLRESSDPVAQQTTQLTQVQWRLLAATAAVGVVLWGTSRLLGEGWRIVGLFGVFLGVYAAVVAAGALPHQIVAERLDRLLDRWVRDKTGKGFYGMVALTVLAWQELDSLVEFVDPGAAAREMIKSQMIQRIIGFSIDTLMHTIHASIWPMWLFRELGLPTMALFMAACWAVFTYGRNHLPMPDMFKKPKPDTPAETPASPVSERQSPP